MQVIYLKQKDFDILLYVLATDFELGLTVTVNFFSNNNFIFDIQKCICDFLCNSFTQKKIYIQPWIG